MAKSVANAVLDAALNYVKTNATLITVTTDAPNYAQATTNFDSSGYKLAGATISASDFTGPGVGDTSGRKLTANAQSSMSIDGIGSGAQNATHVALVKVSSSASSQIVLYVTTCTSQSLTAGNKVNTPAWDMELRAPA